MDEPCTWSGQGGWQVDTSLCDIWSTVPAGVADYAIGFAVQILWAATGRRFGLCDWTVRPCWNQTLPTYITYPSIWNAGQYGGQYAWGLFAFGGASDFLLGGSGCGCATGSACGCMPPQMPLPAPVYQVLSVIVDGTVLDPSAYRADGNLLVRQDGHAWPMTQNLAAPAGQPDTWSVQFLKGEPVPQVLNQVAGVYACEVAKNRMGQACRLPQRIQSITRQGVTAQFITAQDLLDKGMTGLLEVDQVIRAFNPHGITRPPRVLSPDLPQWR